MQVQPPMSEFLTKTIKFLENYEVSNYFDKEAEELVSSDELTVYLMSSKNLNEWVINRFKCDAQIIEECAYKILVRNKLNQRFDFSGVPSEERLLRHVFKNIKSNEPLQSMSKERIVKLLPALTSLNPFEEKVEKGKILCNHIAFKALTLTALFFLRPKMCSLLENRVTPIISKVISEHHSLSVVSSFATGFFSASIHVRSFPIPLWPIGQVFTSIAMERTPEKSLIHRILSAISSIFSVRLYGNALLDDNMTFLSLVGSKIMTSNFTMRNDRDKELEDRFVQEVMSYTGA